MRRSRALLPPSFDALEGRVVLTQVYFSPQTGIIDKTATHIAAPRPVHEAGAASIPEQERADDRAESAQATARHLSPGGIRTTHLTQQPDSTTARLCTAYLAGRHARVMAGWGDLIRQPMPPGSSGAGATMLARTRRI